MTLDRPMDTEEDRILARIEEERRTRITLLTERIMEHLCGALDEGDVRSIVAVLVDYPGIMRR